MKSSKEQKIPGVAIDNKLQLKSHMQELCEKALQKLEGLSNLQDCLSNLIKDCLSNHLNGSEKKLVFHSIVKFCFFNCRRVWIVLFQNIKQHYKQST